MVSHDFSFRTASCAPNERHFEPTARRTGRRIAPRAAARRVRGRIHGGSRGNGTFAGVRMTAGCDLGDIAGSAARHIPVLGGPALDFLNLRAGGTYMDGTFGAGGYSAAMLAAADCRVIGIDRDQTAIAGGG